MTIRTLCCSHHQYYHDVCVCAFDVFCAYAFDALYRICVFCVSSCLLVLRVTSYSFLSFSCASFCGILYRSYCSCRHSFRFPPRRIRWRLLILCQNRKNTFRSCCCQLPHSEMSTERFDCLREQSDCSRNACHPRSTFVVVVYPVRVEDSDRILCR